MLKSLLQKGENLSMKFQLMQIFLTYAPQNPWDAPIPAGLKGLMRWQCDSGVLNLVTLGTFERLQYTIKRSCQAYMWGHDALVKKVWGLFVFSKFCFAKKKSAKRYRSLLKLNSLREQSTDFYKQFHEVKSILLTSYFEYYFFRRLQKYKGLKNCTSSERISYLLTVSNTFFVCQDNI